MNFNDTIIKERHPNVVSYTRGDVNGDRIPENVYLTGTETQDSPFVQNITLVIQDGRGGMATNIPIRQNIGYNPRLFLSDFTGDSVEDILISIDSGGSGGIIYYYIYSYKNNIACLLFDSDAFYEQYKYSVTYRDNYKVEVISKINNAEYIIDISNRGADYLNEIYHKNGKLKNPIEGFVDPIGGLYPVDFDSNGIYELLVFQKIAGKYHADSLGYVQNILKWEKGIFILDNQYLAITMDNIVIRGS